MIFYLEPMEMLKMNKNHLLPTKIKDTKTLLKIVSVFLSMFLWFFVLKSQPVSIKENLLIEFELPEGRSFSSPPKREVEVYLEGLRATLRRSDIEKSKIKIKVPPFEGDSILYVADVERDNIPQPNGVKVNDFFPKKVDLYIERTAEKKVPIKMKFKGELSDDLIINSYAVSPKTVLISGAASVIEKLTELETKEILLNELNLGDSELTTKIELPELLSLSELEDNAVQVDLGISVIKPIVQEFKVPIKFISNGADVFKPSHREVLLRISYSESKMPKKLESDDFGIDVFADLTNVSDKNAVKLEVRGVKNINIVKLKPETISLGD